MAWTGVAHFQTNIDKAARSFADQLLGAGNSLAGYELERSHARGLLEDMSKVRGTKFHQFGEALYRNLLREMFGDVILNLTELANG